MAVDDEERSEGERVFNEPRLAINRVYTRKGDLGSTQLVGGQKVKKDDLRIEAYGTVDELNAFVGAARLTLQDELDSGMRPSRAGLDSAALASRARASLEELSTTLLRVQHELFNLGSILATLAADIHPKQPRVTPVEVARLEAEIDRCQADLAPLRSFVLPGGCRLAVDLHVARTVCRRAERAVVRLAAAEATDADAVTYLNRLSDAFFVWSRWAAKLLDAPEVLWEPDKSASGTS